jgi:hypothetical protein
VKGPNGYPGGWPTGYHSAISTQANWIWRDVVTEINTLLFYWAVLYCVGRVAVVPRDNANVATHTSSCPPSL